jgi:uncharacterized protein YjeT (DUF2065 family)
MEAGIERLAALAFLVNGLSQLAAPGAWARLFIAMRERGDIGGLLNAYLHFPIGIMILAFHWVWNGPGLIVTLIGCALTFKGVLYLTWPRLALRSLAHVSDERAGEFRSPGSSRCCSPGCAAGRAGARSSTTVRFASPPKNRLYFT